MSKPTSKSLIHMPAEWAPHDAYWLAWPWDIELWPNLNAVQTDWLAMAKAIVEKKNDAERPERLEILVHPKADKAALEQSLLQFTQATAFRLHSIPYGDIWLRDTAPIFMHTTEHKLVAHRFAFNGWGGKYIMPDDDNVSKRIVEAADVSEQAFSWILEGGSVEVNGAGLLLTTDSCVLNPNRQAPSRAIVTERLCQAFGVTQAVSLRRGLNFDHTDGHIDNVARFTDVETVLCLKQSGSDDPHADAYPLIKEDLKAIRTTDGKALSVIEIPSPGLVLNGKGEPLPASYLNFVIANHAVVVPIYGTSNDEPALKMIEQLFPNHRVVGINARSILAEGGAFHCISQQQPSASEE